MMKRAISIALILTMTLSSTTFATTTKTDPAVNKTKVYVDYLVAKGIINNNGVFKAEEKVTNAELLSTVLNAQNVMKGEAIEALTDTNAIMVKASENGLAKSNEGLSKATANPTIEQAATVLYRVFKVQRNLGEYWNQYDYSLDHTISDYNQISPYYRPGVAMSFAEGLLSWDEKTKKGENYPTRNIYPKKTLTRGEMCTMVAKLVDGKKRTTRDQLNQLKQTKLIIVNMAKEGTSPIHMSFKNGRPVIDREEELKALWKTTKSTVCQSFDEALTYDEMLKKGWWMKDAIQETYDVSYNCINKAFNVSYKDDLKQYEEDLRFYLPYYESMNNFVNDHIKMIKDKKLTIEGIIVTDPTMEYTPSNNQGRLKIRLYFRYRSSDAMITNIKHRMFNVPWAEATLRTNQWYRVDFEGRSSMYGSSNNGLRDTWIKNDTTYGQTFQLSDFIPVLEIK